MESLGSANAHTTPQLVWYITGASSGLGNHLVHALLARNEKVIATARNLEKLRDLPESDNLRLQQLDVTDGPELLKQKAQEAETFFGKIDVLVNNAGIGSKAFIEEGGSACFKEQYQTNVFGLLDVTTAVLPYMRQRKSGTVVMLGSRSSWQPDNPVTGLYSSSKAAVRVLSETLSVELKHLGIRVLIVEPGAFRTENIFAQPFYDGNEIADYDEQRVMMKKRFEEVAGKQPGDPRKGMELLADVVRGEGRAAGKPWPLYLPLGEEAEQAIRDKCKRMTDVLDTWGEIIRDTRLDNP